MFPPMADLEDQLLIYKDKLVRDYEDLEVNPSFEDGVESLYRDSNTLSLIALSIGMSPEESQYKLSVIPLIQSGQKLSAAKELKEVASGLEQLNKAFEIKGNNNGLSWSKVAHLAPVMKKALPSISTEIKRLTRNEKTFLRGKNAQKIFGASAVLAVIAQGCKPNVDETASPKEKDLWSKYCENLHATACSLNSNAHKVKEGSGKFEDLEKAAHELEETCNTCHEKFGGSTN